MGRILATILAVVLTACVGTGTAPQPELTAYVNGHVFDGERFRRVPLVVGDGRFVEADVAQASRTVDLQGRYVVPPFCEAHNHNLGDSDENEATIERYLRDGIFYVGILSNLPALTDPVRDSYNTPASVDVIFANGPLTATGGHPIRIREFLLERGNYPGFTRETLPGQGYFVIDDEADLERQWPAIVGLRPDVVKIILIFSEEFARRRDDPAFFGQKGLDPALVPRIVERAHARGLRVFAHIETAHDFHVAVRAGVDVLAHLPGHVAPTAIDVGDARVAAERGVILMTTTVTIQRPHRASQRDALREAQIANLRLLRQAGVRLVAGSDEHEQTSTAEIAHLRELGVLRHCSNCCGCGPPIVRARCFRAAASVGSVPVTRRVSSCSAATRCRISMRRAISACA